MPPGDEPVYPGLDVITVTEASALLAPGIEPKDFRRVYYSYPQGLVWAGFNSATRTVGSKLLIGRIPDFVCLRQVMSLTKLYHIDQMYKCFQNEYFTIVGTKKDILMGVRDHISSCGTGPANAMNGFVSIPFK